MINNIAQACEEYPSITLINNGQNSLYMDVGNLKKDNIKSRIIVENNIPLTFSPYAHPFYLNESHKSEGTILNFFTEHPEHMEENTQCLSLHIGGNSTIAFGNLIYINYDGNTFNTQHTPDNLYLNFINAKKTFDSSNTKKTLALKKTLILRRTRESSPNSNSKESLSTLSSHSRGSSPNLHSHSRESSPNLNSHSRENSPNLHYHRKTKEILKDKSHRHSAPLTQ